MVRCCSVLSAPFWAPRAGRSSRGCRLARSPASSGPPATTCSSRIVDRRTYGTAIPAAWVIMWLVLAALEGRWLRAPFRRAWSEVAGRGLVAAGLGGVAFYLVLTTLWGRPPAGGRNYLVQFLAWSVAWAPGLLALTFGGSRATAVKPTSYQIDEFPNGFGSDHF